MIVKEPESQFVQAPPGVYGAVCVDEIDMGLVANKFDPEQPPAPTVRLVWQLSEQMEDGKPFFIKRDYRASLHEKAALRKELESWRGRPFTFDELAGFDLETVVGAPGLINVVQKLSKKGKMFSNISSIMPLPKGMAKLAARDYVRVKDRPKPVSAPMPGPEMQPFGHIDDDDVPF